MLYSFDSTLHIVFDVILYGIPGCMFFGAPSAVQWAETISDRYCKDVFHVYFLPLKKSPVLKTWAKIYEK